MVLSLLVDYHDYPTRTVVALTQIKVINANPWEFAFVEIELKQSA